MGYNTGFRSPEAAVADVREALGEFAVDHDCETIADLAYEYNVERGVREMVVDADRFWEIVEEHQIPRDEDGYGPDGYDREGFDRDGFGHDGIDAEGYNRDGRDEFGFDRAGFDPDGYDEHGYDRDGYDENGLSRDGSPRDGVQ